MTNLRRVSASALSEGVIAASQFNTGCSRPILILAADVSSRAETHPSFVLSYITLP